MNLKLKILLFLYNSEGKILMIKERSQKRDHMGWNFVKGTFEGGETIV
jgi:ADP-ribose pyrophosphatase YjhB (NUDIX family)